MKVATIDGVTPSVDTIATGEYSISRPLFIYVKKEHIGYTVDLKEFVIEYSSDAAISSDGYLVDIGLVPLSDDERIRIQKSVDKL